MPDNNKKYSQDKNRANRDPITGIPGAHPVGTGVGAAAGGAAGAAGGMAAGAAAGTAGAGPIGGVVGAAVGAVVGGLAGKGVAEGVNPTTEDTYWREHYNQEPYYDRTYNYDDYRGAYRTGYEGYSRLGRSGTRYEDVEEELRRDYERNYGTSRLNWNKARPAVRAAWHRFDQDLSSYVGWDVVDRNNNNIGTLECIWADHTGDPAFLGVRTGWFLGKTHVVPAQSVEVSEHRRRLRLPYTEDQIKEAPAYDADSEMTGEKEREVYRYYGVYTGGATTGSTARQGAAARDTATTTARTGPTTGTPATAASMGMGHRTETHGQEGATIQLSEEQLRVEKRDVEAGGVRLRKIVRSEVVNQPVELRREEVVIERVPAGQATGTQPKFEEQEVYIPLRREEAVVHKEARVREEVRAHKQSQTDIQQVSDKVRKEDIEIERSGQAREGERSPGTRKT